MIIKFDSFINEGIRDKMTPKPMEDIEKSLWKQNITKYNAEDLLKNAIKYNFPEIIEKVFDKMLFDYSEQHSLHDWGGDDTFAEFCEDEYEINLNILLSISITTNSDINTNEITPLICKKIDIDFKRKDIQSAFQIIKSIDDLHDTIREKNPDNGTEPPDLNYDEDGFTDYCFMIFTGSNEGYLIGVKNDLNEGVEIYYTYYIEPFGDDDDYCNYLDNYEQLVDEIKKAGLEL